jgi:DNA polymerase IV
MPALCRDCLCHAPTLNAPCRLCGSPRVFSHVELDALTIAHVDSDAFYASVEKRDDPSLANKPLLIGHDGGRGVVTTACYIARQYGCRSAMPMFKALRLCPDAIVKSPDMAKYKAVSREIRALFAEITHLLEPVSSMRLSWTWANLIGSLRSRLPFCSPRCPRKSSAAWA